MTVISEQTMSAWETWMQLTRSRCHLHFQLEGGSLSSHIRAGTRGAEMSVDRIGNDLPMTFQPAHILEIGASVGFNGMALARKYPTAKVYSVEPDREAVCVARAMAEDSGSGYQPLVGTGENLPFCPNCFDLVVCHTVIEHVADVAKVISEMARVLAPGGIIHLEAPNYLWPHEPHLNIWCLPVLGKRSVRLAAKLQGKNDECWYLDHLQFVTPGTLSALFLANGLVGVNRSRQKLLAAMNGQVRVMRYRGAARLLRVLGKWGLGPFIANFFARAGIYPSLLYTLKKQ